VWENTSSVIGWIVSAGAIVATGLAVMWLGLSRTYKEMIDALEKRAVIREQLLVDAQADATKARAEADVLRNVVTGEAHLVVIEGKTDEIRAGLDTHHTEAMAGMKAIADLLVRLVEQGDA
jgi:hypothetical protein